MLVLHLDDLGSKPMVGNYFFFLFFFACHDFVTVVL